MNREMSSRVSFALSGFGGGSWTVLSRVAINERKLARFSSSESSESSLESESAAAFLATAALAGVFFSASESSLSLSSESSDDAAFAAAFEGVALTCAAFGFSSSLSESEESDEEDSAAAAFCRRRGSVRVMGG